MTIKKIVACLLAATSVSIFANSPNNVQYESAEHIFMGDQVILKGLPKPAQGQSYEFTLDNQLKLSYGELIAMPDYYGDPKHQISSDDTFSKRKAWFSHLYERFSNDDVNYFHTFWPIVQKERDRVKAAIKAHQSVSKMYKATIGKELLTLELVTGFKFFALAANCFDHFNHDAWLAYQAGHSVAIDTAITGYKIKSGENNQANHLCAFSFDKQTCLDFLAHQKLKLAYAQNAYSNHFLTDRLASSHMRTPFRTLVETRSIPELGGVAGNYMHNEDGDFGLIVTNSSGKYWIAYGDDYYFSPENAAHRHIINKILQKSADEVYDAFDKGYNTDPYSLALYALVPKPIPAGQTVDVPLVGKVTQSSPLFKVIGNQVWERKDVNNRFDNEWVQNWSVIQLLLTYHLKKLSALWLHYLTTNQSNITDLMNRLKVDKS